MSTKYSLGSGLAPTAAEVDDAEVPTGNPSANHRGGRGRQKSCGDHECYAPRQKPVRRIAEVHFVGVDSRPFGP